MQHWSYWCLWPRTLWFSCIKIMQGVISCVFCTITSFWNCVIPHPDSLLWHWSRPVITVPGQRSLEDAALGLFAGIHGVQTWPPGDTPRAVWALTDPLGFPNLPRSHSSCPTRDGRPQGSSTDTLQFPMASHPPCQAHPKAPWAPHVLLARVTSVQPCS